MASNQKNYTTINMAFHLLKNYGIIIFLKGVLFYFYRRLKRARLNISKEMIIEVNGYKITTIPNDEGISAGLLMFKTHEPINTKLFSRELKKGMVCLDIGSNIGYYALLESKIVGEKGKVIAIEPSPINFKYLEKNCKLQKYSNILTYNFAAAETDGFVNFLINEKSNWSKVVGDNLPNDEGTIIKVTTKQIDSFISEIKINNIDFLRMDVEGYEFNIYQGARKVIRKFKPSLLIEIHKHLMGINKTKQFLEMLKEDGYEVKSYFPRELDVPIVGNINDVKKISIEKILEKLNDKSLFDVFHLLLIKGKE